LDFFEMMIVNSTMNVPWIQKGCSETGCIDLIEEGNMLVIRHIGHTWPKLIFASTHALSTPHAFRHPCNMVV
jgi:hypothetical protein